MNCLLAQFGLLAEGWGQFIGIIVIVGFYLLSAIVKGLGERGVSEEEKEKARQAARRIHEQLAKGKTAAQIEEANRRRLERKLPYAKAVKDHENMSEWDRRQEEKRRRLAQQRQSQFGETPAYHQAKPAGQSNEQVRLEPPPVPVAIPVAQAIDEDAEELKRQQYFAKAQRAQQAHRRSQIQAQRAAAAAKPVRTQKPPAKATAESASTSDFIQNLLKDRNQLRSAILLKEILDKPIAMRDFY